MGAVFRALVGTLCFAGAVMGEVKRPTGLDLLSISSGNSQSWQNTRTRNPEVEETNVIPLLTDKAEQWPEQSDESNDLSWTDGVKERTMQLYSDPSNEAMEDIYDDVIDTIDSGLGAEKRSAVLASMHGGRRLRRGPQPPPPALDLLQDVGKFFGSLRHNLETVASLSPSERAWLQRQKPPSVVLSSAGGGAGAGVDRGFRRLHALRPLHPSYSIRSLPASEYSGANHHDPGLLWTGLGRRRR